MPPSSPTRTRRSEADVQAGLDAYATYYLALAQLEKARLENTPPEQAELLFRNTLELLPEPGPSQPYYHMLRWGAEREPGPDSTRR